MPRSPAWTALTARVTGVRLGDGRVIPCTAALIGVGRHAERRTGARGRPDLRRRHRRRPCRAHRRPVDLRHRRLHPPAAAAVRPHGAAGERAERAGTGQAGGQRDLRQAAADAGSAVVLVRPVRPAAADRRHPVRCRRHRRARQRRRGQSSRCSIWPRTARCRPSKRSMPRPSSWAGGASSSAENSLLARRSKICQCRCSNSRPKAARTKERLMPGSRISSTTAPNTRSKCRSASR